jgi:hypothetical protein
LRHILPQDLKETGWLLDLYAQAVRAELIDDSEATRLAFTGLAQHVLSSRPKNAGGLFHQLLRRHCFHFITQAEEEAAQQLLKQRLYALTKEQVATSTPQRMVRHLEGGGLTM